MFQRPRAGTYRASHQQTPARGGRGEGTQHDIGIGPVIRIDQQAAAAGVDRGVVESLARRAGGVGGDRQRAAAKAERVAAIDQVRRRGHVHKAQRQRPAVDIQPAGKGARGRAIERECSHARFGEPRAAAEDRRGVCADDRGGAVVDIDQTGAPQVDAAARPLIVAVPSWKFRLRAFCGLVKEIV